MTALDIADALMVAAPLVFISGVVYVAIVWPLRPRREVTRVVTVLVREAERAEHAGRGKHRAEDKPQHLQHGGAR